MLICRKKRQSKSLRVETSKNWPFSATRWRAKVHRSRAEKRTANDQGELLGDAEPEHNVNNCTQIPGCLHCTFRNLLHKD
jgi:hypothetical protein